MRLLLATLLFPLIALAAGLSTPELPAPEPMACYGVAPQCSYPLVQCCVDYRWTCCRKGY